MPSTSALDELSLEQLQWLFKAGVVVVGLSVRLASVEVLEFIAASFPQLKRLRGNMVNRDLYSAFPELARKCLEIESIRLSGAVMRFFRPSGVDIDRCTSGIADIAHHCKLLKEIHVAEMDIVDTAILALCSNCPHLQHINISHCYNLTDGALLAIADAYPHLHSLNIKQCNVTDNALISFANHCRELQSVAVSGPSITNNGLAALSAANPNLTAVDFSEWKAIVNEDIFMLLRYCMNLSSLNICRCPHITDAAVIAVAEHCPQLALLNIRECQSISDTSLHALAQYCHGLKSIDISHIKNISDEGVSALAVKCSMLQEFAASYSKLTDAGLTALAYNCRDLRKINLSACKNVTVDALHKLVMNCKLLCDLDLSYCQLDDASFLVLAPHCSNLICLNVGFTGIKDVKTIHTIKQLCSWLSGVNFKYNL